MTGDNDRFICKPFKNHYDRRIKFAELLRAQFSYTNSAFFKSEYYIENFLARRI